MLNRVYFRIADIGLTRGYRMHLLTQIVAQIRYRHARGVLSVNF